MTAVSLPSGFHDERGSIQTLLNQHNGSVVAIDTVPGVERANHYHKEDYHYCYVVSGSIIYYERPVGSTQIPMMAKYSAGEMIYTGPMIEHCMYFEEPTVFITLGGGTRKQEDYELDLVRIESLKAEFDAAFGNVR
jgi:quercetin dioxygenase-like cupin family protein